MYVDALLCKIFNNDHRMDLTLSTFHHMQVGPNLRTACQRVGCATRYTCSALEETSKERIWQYTGQSHASVIGPLLFTSTAHLIMSPDCAVRFGCLPDLAHLQHSVPWGL
jgi:hypothetical protein